MITFFKDLFKPTEQEIKDKWARIFAAYSGVHPNFNEYLEFKKLEKSELRKYGYL